MTKFELSYHPCFSPMFFCKVYPYVFHACFLPSFHPCFFISHLFSHILFSPNFFSPILSTKFSPVPFSPIFFSTMLSTKFEPYTFSPIFSHGHTFTHTFLSPIFFYPYFLQSFRLYFFTHTFLQGFYLYPFTKFSPELFHPYFPSILSTKFAPILFFTHL